MLSRRSSCVSTLLTAVFSLVSLSWSRETDRLFYFETLNSLTVTSRVKRSASTGGATASLLKDVRFRAFQRDFHLSLRSGSPVLASGFRARLVHGDGGSTSFTVDQSRIFSGHVVNSRGSKVSAHLEGAGLWTIHILERGDSYGLEPAPRLLGVKDNPRNHTLVTYRLSDVKGLPVRYRFCDATAWGDDRNRSRLSATPTGGGGVASQRRSHTGTKHVRQKRRIPDTCLMYLVGDTSLYRDRCQSDHMVCSALILSFLQTTDDLFRGSRFEDRLGHYFTGVGVQVGELVLLTDHTPSSGRLGDRHFNEPIAWRAQSKLMAFARQMARQEKTYCLYHLVTELADPAAVVGRAYSDVLCGWGSGRDLAYNSAVTSGTNKMGKLLPTLMSAIVFAHEIGHNFGAHHDPHTSECAPDDTRGGKFLMWAYAVRGENQNNPHFSRCSLRQIGRNLPAWCFKARTALHQFCGNGVVDAGEECDAGSFGLLDQNTCCSQQCTLRPGAACSEVNDECCTDCQIAPVSTVCRVPGYTHGCIRESYCHGTSTICPDGEHLPDGTNCSEEHVCYRGVCIGPCEQASRSYNNGTLLKPCRCAGRNATEQCMYCCFDATDRKQPGECRPLLPRPRPDGALCDGGICEHGACRRHVVLSVVNLEAYIQYVRTSSLEKFLRANVVLVVVLLSLLLWLPPSVLVHRRDCHERQAREEVEEALRKVLSHTEDTNTVVQDWLKRKESGSDVDSYVYFPSREELEQVLSTSAVTSTRNLKKTPSRSKVKSKPDRPKKASKSFSQMLTVDSDDESYV